MASRAARVDDAPRIVELIRAGFDARLLDLFIYGCDGVTRYVEGQIAAYDAGSDTRYFVTDGDATVMACAEMRLLPDRLFLNYIAVAPGNGRRGHGSRLLRAAIASLLRPEHEVLSLDVLEANAAAIAWYDRLMIAPTSVTAWYEMPLPDTPAATGIVIGLPQALVCHRELGFGRCSITTDRTYDIGLLGKRWFRVTDPAALADARVLASLHAIDPGRRILALVAAESKVPSSANLVTRTQRRSGGIRDVLRVLAEESA